MRKGPEHFVKLSGIRIYRSTVLGSEIARLRKSKGKSQKDIADILGIQQPAYSRMENGGTHITCEQLFNIAAALDVKASDILARVEFLATAVVNKVELVNGQFIINGEPICL